MKKALWSIAVLLALIVGALSLTPVRALLIAQMLPDYPNWPDPVESLGGDETGKIYYASASPYDLEVILGNMDLARATTGLGYLSYPEAATAESPVPAMVLVPGSGGIAEGREHAYAQWLNERGIAAFVVEYYAPRGFGKDDNYLIRTSSVTEFDLITDAYAARALLATSPRIDGARIGMIGFSYGGMATRLSMDARIAKALAQGAPPFAMHIDVYGPCFQYLKSVAVTGAPLLTLRGTQDASNDLQACARREQALRALGVDVTAKIYEGAGHAWENLAPAAMQADAPYLAGCEITYDENGRAYLDGEPLTDYPPDASHATKMAARFSSGARFKDCVGYGYVVGRNEEARARGYADIGAFLDKVWGDKGVDQP